MSTRRPRKARGAAAAAGSTAAVRYRIEPIDPKAHLFEIVCDVARPEPTGQRVSLPTWIPGSYLIREFARHVVAIAAECDGRPIALVKRDKHSWETAPCTGPLRLRYRVYAWDWSVRAAHLDETHGFFNGTSVFLEIAGLSHEPHEVEIVAPRGAAYRGWRVATALPEAGAPRHGFGSYRADDYDALIDHPVEMGAFRLERYEARGVPHEIAWSGVVPNFDAARVNADLGVLCAAQIAFFGDPAPFARYVFLAAVAGEGMGGLEHRASTALLCPRDGLPAVGDPAERSAAYLNFLGLVSHEYFHAWNVKRMKPAAFAPYDLARENPTSLLWIFEGFTSYYDDVFLVRGGLATHAQYLAMVAKTLDEVLAGPGRLAQSVAESSFDAWTKYYRQDENTPNAVVSYYRKGSLVALCLDLAIRRASGGRASLDDAMRLMWRRYGRDFYPDGRRGIGEDEFPDLVLEATGVDVRDDVARWACGTDELPLAELLRVVGCALESERSGPAATLGARVAPAGNETRLSVVVAGGAAHAAGLAAGDVLVAIDGLRVAGHRLAPLLARYRAGDTIDIAFFRADVLMSRRVVLDAGGVTSRIVPVERAGKRALAERERWLGQPRSAARRRRG